MSAPNFETQQHLSNVLCVNLQTNLPSLISQQHSFTSFPVSLQPIFFGAQHPTSNSEKKFASIRVIRGYKIDHQRSVPDQLHSLRVSARSSEPPATIVSSN